VSVLDFELDSLEIDNIGNWPLLGRCLCIGLACLGILLSAYFYDIVAQWEQYICVKLEREVIDKIFVQKQSQVMHIDAYRQQMKTIRETFETLKRQLPDGKEEAEFLEAISQQASAAGLTFLSIKPSPEENKGFYVEYPLELKLSGFYHGIGSFVSHISGMSRMVTLHDFMLKAEKSEKTSFGKIDFSLIAKTYWTEKPN
jgi:type IV pilus assembly protein PilO